MGIFDFLMKETAEESRGTKKQPRSAAATQNTPINFRDANGGALQVFHPQSFQDVEKIVNTLRDNKAVIVYLTEVKFETAQRVLDLLSGATFALDGGAYEIDSNIFVFTPDGVKVN